MTKIASYRYLAATIPGMAGFHQEELAKLGILPKKAKKSVSGIELSGSAETAFRLLLEARMAEQVWLKMPSFTARTFDDLKAGLAKLALHAHLPAGQALSVRATCKHSRLIHSDAVVERAADVFAKRFNVTNNKAIS